MSVSLKSHVMLAMIFSLLAILLQAKDYTFENYSGDTQGYIKVAYDLADKGIFTDGHYGALATTTGPNGEGMFFAPLYPLMLAGIIKIDPVFRELAKCYAEKEETVDRQQCPQKLGLLKIVQIALAVLSLFMVWIAGWLLTRRINTAWLALVLASVAEAYAYYTGFIMTEALVFPLFTASCLLSVVAWKTKSNSYFLILGLALGLLTLTRPSFAYLFYACIPALSVMALYLKQQSVFKKIQMPLYLFCGFCLVVAPWIIRNGLILGNYSISSGYAPFVLAQRVAYNDMSWKEWGASFIFGLPDFGDSLVKDFFEPQDYERLDYGNPKGYYMMSNQALWDEVNNGGKIPESRLSEIIKKDIFGDLYKHVLVTFSLAWRGMWVSKYWGLVTIPLFLGLFIYALRRKWAEFLIFSIPPWFMLGFNAFTSVNVVRYNLVLVPCLAVATAFLVVAALDKIRNRKKTLSPP